jgi:hypothetical protein
MKTPLPALLNRSWPRLKRSPLAFSVPSADHAVAVFVSTHPDNAFDRLVGDCDNAGNGSRRQIHQLFAVVLKCCDHAAADRRADMLTP